MLIPDTFLTVHEELLLFLGAILLGCVLELVFDIFRAFRIIIPHKAVANAIEDIIFIMIWSGCLICFTSIFAKGVFRIFYIIGSVLGFILCRVTIGNSLVRILSLISNVLLRIIKWIFSPFIKLCTWIHNKFVRKFVNNAKISRRIKNICSFPLIAVQKMLYNIFNSNGKKGEKENGDRQDNSKT